MKTLLKILEKINEFDDSLEQNPTKLILVLVIFSILLLLFCKNYGYTMPGSYGRYQDEFYIMDEEMHH